MQKQAFKKSFRKGGAPELKLEGIDIEKASMKDVIADFKSSDAPQFKGKSDKKKKEMAIAAKLSKEEFEIDESTKEYAKSLEKIANDRTLKTLSKSERENLKKIADLLAKEEVEIDEGNSAYDKQIAAFIAKGGKIKKLSVNKKEISKAAAEFKKKFKTDQQALIKKLNLI